MIAALLLSSLALADAPTRAEQAATMLAHPHHPTKLLVRFRSGTNSTTEKDVHARCGGTVTYKSPFPERAKTVEISNVDLSTALQNYLAEPSVLYAEPDYKIFATAVPNDEHFAPWQWGLRNTGQVIIVPGTIGADINVVPAWDLWTGDASFAVGVLDSGIQGADDEGIPVDHPDLIENLWTNPIEVLGDKNLDNCPGICAIDDDGDGLIDEDSQGRNWDDPDYFNDLGDDDDENGFADDIHGPNLVDHLVTQIDETGHGTAVAGIIGGRSNNGLGMAGINWEVDLVALKVFPEPFGDAFVEHVLEAIDYMILNDIRLSNSSWNLNGYSQELFNGMELAQSYGHLFIVGAGNDSQSIDRICSLTGDFCCTDADCPPQETCVEPGTDRVYPSAFCLDNIISVGATDNIDEPADFGLDGRTSFGAHSVDIFAPGMNIITTVPDTSYAFVSGTSFAAPHVTGVAALVWSRHPYLSWQQVKDRILSTARPVASLCGLCVTGGVVDAYAALVPFGDDCNGNGAADECDVDCALPGCGPPCGTSADCNGNYIPDECEPDCDLNGIADPCELLAGTAQDCNSNAVPDSCEPYADCNGNNINDVCDIAATKSRDCNMNDVPDECERRRLYVDANAAGGTGESWPLAYNNLQDALAEHTGPCKCGDPVSGLEIWVAAGEYRPDIGVGQQLGDDSAVFDLPPDTSVYGGFGGWETEFWQRDLIQNPTVLSGDLLQDDILRLAEGLRCNGEDGFAPPAPCLVFDEDLDGDVDNYDLHITDNSLHVVSGSMGNTASLLDGFVIRAAKNAGIRLEDAAAEFRNCRIMANWQSGVSLENANTTLVNCVIHHNASAASGGGIEVSHGKTEIINTTIWGNDAHDTTWLNFCCDTGGLEVFAIPGNDNITVVRNTSFWENRADGMALAEEQIGFTDANMDIDYVVCEGHAGAEHIYVQNPNVFNPIGLDGIAGTLDDEFRMDNHSSIAVDSGDSSAVPQNVLYDLDDRVRIVDVVDLGPYEFSDCDGDGTDDGTQIFRGFSSDDDHNGIPDGCVAYTPHAVAGGVAKNRYISIGTGNEETRVAFRVTLTDSWNHDAAVGSSWWIGWPDENGISDLGSSPITRNWEHNTIHITGCEVSPVAIYAIETTLDAGISFSTPLVIGTIEKPGFKFWGDTVGFFDGQVWSPPNGVVNADDFVAAIKTFQDPTAFNATHLSVTDVEDQGPNRVVNINDVFMIILGFIGDEYPYGCPDDPCWDTRPIVDGGDGPCPCVPPVGGESAPLGPATVSTLSLLASSDLILQGELIDVEVFLDVADDLGGYQLDVEVTGGDAGSLDLVDLFIDDTRFDYVFFGVNSLESVSSFWGQVGAANLDGVGISVTGPAYLGTFQFRASADAVGVFSIRFADIENNFLMNGGARRMRDAIADDKAFIGVEVECAIDSHCDDGNPCTDDACNNGTCVYTNDDTNTCSDGNDCTDDSCSSGTCVSTNDDTNTCTDGNDCTADSCLSGVCTGTNEPVNTACDDGLFCTKTDKCDGAGVCVGTGDPCRGQNRYCCESLSTCGPFPCS